MLSAQVQPDIVKINIQNLTDRMMLNENIIIEKYNDDNTWEFAACPLWMCETKETIFSQEIEPGETAIINWNRKLHKDCLTAPPGKYRALIKNLNGKLLSLPVEFFLHNK